MSAVSEALDRLRADGWSVAVHNDYRLNGVFNTFWLFTHTEKGLFAKGEGRTDEEAIAAAAAEAAELVKDWNVVSEAAVSGVELAKRVIGEVRLAVRWPCPDCGRAGPEAPLRHLRVTPCGDANGLLSRDGSIGPTHWTGCWRCNEGDRLVALAERVLTG